MVKRIAFVGLGEASSAIISGWGSAKPAAIQVFDIKSLDPLTAPLIASRGAELGIHACATPQEALADAEIVFSTVTADQAVAAAESYAPHLAPDALWCDLNSCAPHSKQNASELVEEAGGRYLDVAVMAPVYPKQNMVPCLLSGPHADVAKPMLDALPMATRIVGAEVGRASSIKLVRSIMVKGLEALSAECALAAAAAGVSDDVFPSLKDGHPQIDVPDRAAYNLERMAAHGVRRAAEMDECAKMLEHLGLPNTMSLGTSTWQRKIAAANLPMDAAQDADWHWFAEHLLGGTLLKEG